MRLPLSTRQTLAAHFGFSKIGPTHVQDNKVVSDGYNIEDVERSLNVDALQQYVGSEETDMAKLWEMMTYKAEGRIPEEEIAALVSEPTELNAEPLPITPEPKKRGRPAKN